MSVWFPTEEELEIIKERFTGQSANKEAVRDTIRNFLIFFLVLSILSMIIVRSYCLQNTADPFCIRLETFITRVVGEKTLGEYQESTTPSP